MIYLIGDGSMGTDKFLSLYAQVFDCMGTDKFLSLYAQVFDCNCRVSKCGRDKCIE